MITYARLARNPKGFKVLSGLTIGEFDALYERFAVAWEEAEERRLTRPGRQRAIGAGGQYRLSLRTRLLMVMVWLRLYLTTEAVGCLFGVDKSTVSRNGRRILEVLRQVSETEFGWPDPPQHGQGRSLQQALKDYPDLFAIIDATEQPVRRAQDSQSQRDHYSGKKKQHTRKTAIVVNEVGLIRDISSSTPGSVHDIRHVRESALLEKIPKEAGVIGDAGFDGLYHDLPDHSVATPHKARRNHPLTDEEKRINQELSRLRIIVENTLCHIKHFNALAQRFRHSPTIQDAAFRVVAAIVNRRTRARLAEVTA